MPVLARSRSTLAPGQRFGPFCIVRLLGQGGMGEVYEAEEAEGGRRVALKLLSGRLGSAEARKRFLREGRLAASISHPHCVCVFGTDEIEGLPVISMEFVASGTLKEMVSLRGPLSPREAVDAILQVVAGLEAAAATGVLHRDVKPDNCFVDRDGTVKVGDFGLSTSRLARDQTQLTLPGTIMCTPAFASPEQLRSEDLDVRSDIYSVGATLYYLLTGRVPFEETNFVRLVTMVAQEMPQAPRTIRREIPGGLSTVVLRTLAKRPDDRFADYAALRAALEPFSSTVPVPAPLGPRAAAFIVDFLAIIVLALLTSRMGIENLTSAVWRHTYGGFGLMLVLAYWVLFEGLSGASPGKRVFRLRVIGRTGLPAGFRDVLVRTLIFVCVPLVVLEALGRLPFSAVREFPAFGVLSGLAVLFCPARRRNGWGGLHELAGATRVIATPGRERAAVRAASVTTPLGIGRSRIGPYAVVGDPAAGAGSRVVAAWDEKLRRPVWLHVENAGGALPTWRRDLARPARLRWLAGRHSDAAPWDAYEAVGGRSFLATVGSPQPWGTVRWWLRDLSEEIEAGLAEGSLPALGLDRLWVGGDGRIRLLDWPAPNGEHQSESPRLPDAASADLAAAERFLALVARTGMAGCAAGRTHGASVSSSPLPLAASAFLADLADSRLKSAREIVARARLTVRGPTAVSRARRAVHLAFCGVPPFIPLFLAWFMGATGSEYLPLDFSRRSDAIDYNRAIESLARSAQAPDTAETRELRWAREIDIADRFHRFLNPPTGPSPSAQMASPAVEAIIRRIRTDHATPSVDEVRRAREVLAPIKKNEQERRARYQEGVRRILPRFALMNVAVFAVVGFLLAVVVRGGLMLRLLDIAVVDRTGSEVPRWRSVLRAFVAWLPIVAAGIIAFFSLGAPEVLAVRPLAFLSLIGMQYGGWVAGALLLTFLGGAVCAVVRPDRGLQDRVAGTYLVPR